jgi:EAL domain-containing protein (putative c-di-GMP-specific phosphodiesterase class I)
VFRPCIARDGRVVSAVALVRRREPDHWGSADLRSLEDACAAAARWWPSSPVPVELSVSVGDLTPRVADRVAATLLRAGLPPTAVVIRLDQTVLAAAPEAVPTLLAALRSRGIPSAVDAYGGGAVVLARLRDLPVDRIALDPAVAAAVVSDPNAFLVVGHTVALARALGSVVHATSVDARTDAALIRLGCQVLGAGAGPLTAEGLEQWLRHRDDEAGLPVG